VTAASTMLAAGDRVFSLLVEAFAGQDDTAVIYGPIGTVTFTPGRVVRVGNIVFGGAVSTFGDGLDETYDIEVVCEATLAGTDQRAAAAAAGQLYDTAMSALTTGPDNLSIPGVMWARPTGRGEIRHAQDARTLAQGRSTAIPFNVNCLAAL
jgi:hypothetical protein